MTGRRHLKHIIDTLLRESNEEKPIVGEDSVDDQIDRYLTNYESEAKNSKNEGLNFRDMTRRFLIEADEDEDKGSEEKPEKLTADDIDVGTFVSDVVRLVENYDSLLELRNTILRRAVNFLIKGYETDVVESFKQELLEGHGMEIGASKQDAAEKFPAPKAGAAGPAGGGGA